MSTRTLGIMSALVQQARHQGLEPVRFVLGWRVVPRIGRETGEVVVGTMQRHGMSIWGVPIVVDETAADGFGLVTRPPEREIMQDPQGGANAH